MGPTHSVVQQGEIEVGRSTERWPEKQTLLRFHQAGGKRQVVGYRIELYIKNLGFSRNPSSQCLFRPP